MAVEHRPQQSAQESALWVIGRSFDTFRNLSEATLGALPLRGLPINFLLRRTVSGGL